MRWAWVAVEAILLGLLFRRHLASRYPWFAAMLGCGLLQQIVLMRFHQASLAYLHGWALGELLRLTLLALAAIELTRHIMDHYPRIADLAATGFGAIFGLGILAGTIATAPWMESSQWMRVQEYIAFKLLRWESTALLAYLLSQAIWFSIFPVSMRRNVVLQRWLLALYGGAIPALAVILIEIQSLRGNPGWQNKVNLSMMIGEVLCLVVWCVWFTPQGELGPQAKDEHEGDWPDELKQVGHRTTDSYIGTISSAA